MLSLQKRNWKHLLTQKTSYHHCEICKMKIWEVLATSYVHPDVNRFLKKYEKQAKGRSRMGYHSMMAYPYRVEGWSQKYKKSINCNNPKGFSQKAHCAGRKKK